MNKFCVLISLISFLLSCSSVEALDEHDLADYIRIAKECYLINQDHAPENIGLELREKLEAISLEDIVEVKKFKYDYTSITFKTRSNDAHFYISIDIDFQKKGCDRFSIFRLLD